MVFVVPKFQILKIMASDNAINVESWTQLLANAPDSQEVKWQKAIVLGTRGRVNPFSGLIGGLNGMKPITEVMDFRALQGQEIVITLDRPLGGRGTQGPASLNRVVGHEENIQQATYRCKVGLMAHMVAGEQIMESETVIGLDWDNRQRRKLTEWFAWKQADDIQFEFKRAAGVYTTYYPNQTSIDTLTTNDTLSLSTITDVQEMLNANQAGPFDIRKTEESGEEVLKYLLMGPAKAWKGLQSSNAYLNLLSNADNRGSDNRLFKGGLPEYFGMCLYKWNVEDGTQNGPLGAPCSPVAYLGATLPATTTTTGLPNIQGGGTNAIAAALLDPYFFQYYEGCQYMGHEGEKQAATTNVTYYLGMRIMTGSDAGKIAIFSYQVNNGNQIVILARLGASITGQINTTIGNMVYNGAGSAWTSTAGPNGFNGVSTGIVPIGSPIFQINANGVPYVRSYALGRNAIIAGWGNLAPNKAYGSGGGGSAGTPGQRLFQAQDGGRIFSVGWQQVWGSTAAQNANNLPNGFVLIVSAHQPSGWPDVGPNGTT